MSVVRFTPTGDLGYITLDRPPANSYEIGFMRDLDAAVEAAQGHPDVRVVVLRSASEKFFSAGADIKAFAANDAAANMEMIRTAHAALDKMEASPKVFIAAINSHALGGGMEMALACDLRFAAAGAYKLGLPEVGLGLLPGNGGTRRMAQLIGPNRALEMMITGRRVGPDEALEMGIVNRVFPASELNERIAEYAARLASGASVAIAAIKKAVYRGIDLDHAEAMAMERDLIASLFETRDAREGFAAFAEKRRPNFKGE